MICLRKGKRYERLRNEVELDMISLRKGKDMKRKEKR
jgi:hypothetical protein